MRLRSENCSIRQHMLDGMTGLELESHRIDKEGRLARTPHPFAGDPYIDRDFSEDQIEINTPPKKETAEALGFLRDQLSIVHRSLQAQGELLWPFSNPPVIGSEEDIPIARYDGDLAPSYHYRLYLAERYGKYKMTYSGIHFNYSFDEDLLRANRQIELGAGDVEEMSFDEYRDQFYLRLAEKALCYSWAVVSLLAASPLADNSFYETGKSGQTIFTGFSSLRCSEYGYWNPFLPILSYGTVDSYADSIEVYLKQGMLIQARELYYPVRIKPPGRYTLKGLRELGINHIELRQIDLNPLVEEGLDLRDAEFLKLLLVWLASKEMEPLSMQDQMQALQNHKTAAAYDWDLARIALPGQKAAALRQYLNELLEEMDDFFGGMSQAEQIIAYQKKKLQAEENRYACRVREIYADDYIGSGIRRAQQIQEAFYV
ncbi:MAG: hypothetical protein IJ128_08150 [Firmicutes bacterium]|nr:hypothetical protein [Bacillota bacterium]